MEQTIEIQGKSYTADEALKLVRKNLVVGVSIGIAFSAICTMLFLTIKYPMGIRSKGL